MSNPTTETLLELLAWARIKKDEADKDYYNQTAFDAYCDLIAELERRIGDQHA
jgi:hypothetical protein